MKPPSAFLTGPTAKLAISLVLVAVYRLLGRLPPLPVSSFEEVSRPLYLGVLPFFTGFLLIEFYSLTPWGRRQRENGLEGRRRLNGWGFKMGLLVAFVQSLGIALVAAPELGARFLVLLTTIAGSVAAYVLARWISVWGLGNGFCWFAFVDYVATLIPDPGSGVRILESALPLWLILALICGLLVIFERRRRTYEVVDDKGQTRDVALPAFPQSVSPVAWAASAWVFLRPEGDLRVAGIDILGDVVLVAIGALVGLYFFSTRRRVEYNLGMKPGEGFATVLKRELGVSTGILLIGVAVDRVWWIAFNNAWTDLGPLPLDTIGVLVLVFIGLDLFDEWTFMKRHGDVVSVVELDNVHLASWLRSELEAREIPATIRAFRFRSLGFMLDPLYKMVLLVPAPLASQAEEVFAEKQPRIV